MRVILGAVVCGGSLLLAARADRAAAQQIVSELRVGVLVHDIRFLGTRKEGSADLNGELLFASPVADTAVANVPPAVR